MTLAAIIADLRSVIAAWEHDAQIAISREDLSRAHDCRLVARALESYRDHLVEVARGPDRTEEH